jgi:poly(A) polymerase
LNNPPSTAKSHPGIAEVVAFLTQQGTDAYFVGGCVRDALLGRIITDWDIAVSGDATDIAQRLAAHLGGVYVPLDVDRGIARVVFPVEDDQWHMDLTSFQDDIEADLGRRDFTINGMAARVPGLMSAGGEGDIDSAPFSRIDTSSIIDPFGGLKDLAEGRIKAVGEGIFQDDPIRLLRAVRLSAEYGFTIEEDTERLMGLHADHLDRVASERVRDELTRLMSVSSSASYLYYLDQIGLLTAVFPELDEMKGVEQPKEHFWEVFQHSLETVVGVERLLGMEDQIAACVPWLGDAVPHFDEEVGSVKRSVLLKIAALFHDVAKPRAKSIQPDGRMRFFGHPKEGAAIASEAMHRLKFSTQQVRAVQCMIENHLRLWQMSNDDMPTRRATYRYFRDTEDVSVDIIVLSLGDFLATVGPRLDLEELRAHAQLMGYMLSEYQKDETIARPPKLISGHDLISLFDMEPGPEIGRVLEVVREAQGAGEIHTREEALDLVRSHIGGYLSS